MSRATGFNIAFALVAAGLLVAAGVAYKVSAAPTPQIVPQPIPDGYGFPTDAATINRWVATSDTAAMRAHAWDLWNGMSQPSGQIYEGRSLPIWATWQESGEVFPPAAEVNAVRPRAPRGRVLNDFAEPRQFHHNPAALHLAAAAANPFNLKVLVAFDPVAAGFLMAPQAGPGGATYHYNGQASLQALNAAWPASATGQERGINEFPVRAIETKPVFGVVKASGLSVQPLWQGPSASTNPANPTPPTWTSCVLIDPAASGALRPATAAQIAAAKSQLTGYSCRTFYYGPVSLFYNFRMTAAEAKKFRAAAGDYAVLLGMHVNTKEIPFWAWQTFWWQPGPDAPGGLPGTKAGQPASLAQPWSNYAACVNYDQTTTPGGPTMDVCYNPYLETSPSIPAGVASNCMSCHGVARVMQDITKETYPDDYRAPIDFFKNATYFNKTSTHTDFSWAVPSAN